MEIYPTHIYKPKFDNNFKTSFTDNVIILDLDETLIHSFDGFDDLHRLQILTDPKKLDIRKRIYVLHLDDPVDAKGTGYVEKMWGIKRPYLDDFLRFCFSYFKLVIVWTAGVERYAEGIINHIFKDIGKPHLIFARNKCVNGAKPISKIIQAMVKKDFYELNNASSELVNLIENGYVLSPENFLSLDDKTYTYENNPNNGIQIPEFKPSVVISELRKNDICLKQLMNWLMLKNVRHSPDVRFLDKSIIFSDNNMKTGLSHKEQSNLIEESETEEELIDVTA